MVRFCVRKFNRKGKNPKITDYEADISSAIRPKLYGLMIIKSECSSVAG